MTHAKSSLYRSYNASTLMSHYKIGPRSVHRLVCADQFFGTWWINFSAAQNGGLTPRAQSSECNPPGTIRPLKGHFWVMIKWFANFNFKGPPTRPRIFVLKFQWLGSKFSNIINTIWKLIKFCILHRRLFIIGLCSKYFNIRSNTERPLKGQLCLGS